MKRLLNSLYVLLPLMVFSILLLTVIRASIFENVAEEKHIYFEIVFLLLLAAAGEMAVLYLKQPSVMVLLLLGMLVSPSFISLAWDAARTYLPFALSAQPPAILGHEEIIHVFAQLGAVILLFKVGLHNRIERIFSSENLVVATLGVIFPFIAGYLYASMSGGDFAYSMFLGAALTATSVGVTAAVLKELNLMRERYAQIILGAAVIDDVLGLLVLSFVINVSSGAGSLISIALTFVSAVVFLLGSVMAGNYFVDFIDRKELTPRRLLLVLAMMLFFAYVAEFIQLSAIVGAFIAGVIMNRSRHVAGIEEKTYGLELLFMPIFFVSLGILVDVKALFIFIIPIICITAIAILTKIIACSIGSLSARIPPRDSLLVGVGMVPRGEVALIVGSIGLSSGVLDASQYSIITAMALLTTFLVPPALALMLKK